MSQGLIVEIKHQSDGFCWEIDVDGNILTSGSVFVSKEEALDDALGHYQEFCAIFSDGIEP